MFKFIFTTAIFSFGVLVGTHMTQTEGELHTRLLTSIQKSIDDVIEVVEGFTSDGIKTAESPPDPAEVTVARAS
ncbi:MAG: hypothetical protein ACE366_21740 [Bradymonadia bacterium]